MYCLSIKGLVACSMFSFSQHKRVLEEIEDNFFAEMFIVTLQCALLVLLLAILTPSRVNSQGNVRKIEMAASDRLTIAADSAFCCGDVQV